MTSKKTFCMTFPVNGNISFELTFEKIKIKTICVHGDVAYIRAIRINFKTHFIQALNSFWITKIHKMRWQQKKKMEESNFPQTESSRSGSRLFLYIPPMTLNYLQFKNLVIISSRYYNILVWLAIVFINTINKQSFLSIYFYNDIFYCRQV